MKNFFRALLRLMAFMPASYATHDVIVIEHAGKVGERADYIERPIAFRTRSRLSEEAAGSQQSAAAARASDDGCVAVVAQPTTPLSSSSSSSESLAGGAGFSGASAAGVYQMKLINSGSNRRTSSNVHQSKLVRRPEHAHPDAISYSWGFYPTRAQAVVPRRTRTRPRRPAPPSTVDPLRRRASCCSPRPSGRACE